MSMWGGGVAPPRPPSVAPPSLAPPPKTSSNGKHYAQDRQSELEALRQRGLAKLLNKHFTTVTKTIAEERAAAEAALKDLEVRKANTSEFVESTNDGLSMYEKLYKELHQKKAECKRKERETLLLYQRYVDKFGNTGIVQVPSAREMKIGMPPTGHLGTPTITRAMYQNKDKYLPEGMSPNSSIKVPQMAGEIEEELEKHVSSGAHKLPSAETMGFDDTLQSRRAEAEKETAEFNRRALEARGVDAVYSPSRTRNKQAAASQFGIPMSPGRKLSEGSPTPNAEDATFDEEDEEDDRSAVSGLTSTAASETEARLIDFLKTETANIRDMMDNEDTHSNASRTVGASITSYATSVVGTESANAADKAEAMVRQMQKILNGHDGGEHERGLLDAGFEAYELDTPNPQETWIVLWDDNHQREYYHETRSGLVQWEKPRCDEDDYAPIADYTKSSQTRDLMSDSGSTRSSPMNRRLSRRDVYRLKQRRRRNRRRIVAVFVGILTFGGAYYVYHRHQTDPAFADRMSRNIIDPAERLMGRVVGMERIKEINNVLYSTAVSFMPRAVTEEEERRIREDTERKVHAEIARKEAERLSKLESQRLAKEEKFRKEAGDKVAKIKKEQARVETESVAKEQAAQKEAARKEAAARKELERLAEGESMSKGMKRALIKKKRKEAEAAKRREIEERKKNALRRPWHCNIPMSYVLNAKCRKLSSANPVFDLKALIDAMMQ
jgi:hypothetical protein